MPTKEDATLDAARAEFDAARDELSAAQEAWKQASTAANTAARDKAQARYAKAGHDVRLAEDPELDVDVSEYQRHLTARSRARALRAKGGKSDG